MPSSNPIDDLAERFRQLGAPDPRAWAESQVREGIPQLARFLFLRQAWRLVASETDPSWISAWKASAEREPDAPYAGAGHAIKRLKTLGASDEDLTDLVRGAQAELLFSFCYLLDDAGIDDAAGADMAWALVQVSDKGEVLAPISGLHESVLELDPTGRQMRPRGRDV